MTRFGVNPVLLSEARLNLDRFCVPPGAQKAGFLSADDPSFGSGDPNAAAAGGQGGQPGGDPSGGAGGGAAGGGGDAGGAGGGMTPDIQAAIQMAVQQSMQSMQMQGGGAGAAGGPAKPKLDVAVELHRMNRLLAKLVDAQGIQVGAEEMIGDEEAIATNPTGVGQPGGQAGNPALANAASVGQPGGQSAGGIQPLSPMPAAQMGQQTKQSSLADAMRDTTGLSNRASALRQIMNQRGNGAG